MISINIYEIIMQMVNFVILIWLLNKFLYKPLIKYIDQRQSIIKKNLDEAQNNKDKSEEILVQQQQLLQQAHQEARDIRQNAEQSTQKEREVILNNTRDESAQLLDNAKKEIDLSVLKAKQTLQQEVGSLAVNLARKFVQNNMDPKSNEEVVKAYLERTRN